MLIDFETMETASIANFKGGEGAIHAKMFTNELGKIMKCRLPLGSTVGLHTHETNSEIILVLSGEADHICNGETEKLSAGLCGYCPKGSSHTLITTSEEDLVFYAIVPEQ